MTSVRSPSPARPQGAAARAHAEGIAPAIMARSGIDVADLEHLRDVLGRVIAAARTTA